MSRPPGCNLSRRWHDRHCQSVNIARPAAAADAVTCSDYNFTDVPEVATGSVVIIKDSWNLFIIYFIYICYIRIRFFLFQTYVGWSFSFVYSLFVMRNFNYFLDKCGVLNEIIEPTICIFKINTNKISNTRLRRISKHGLIPISSVKTPTKHLLTF